MNIQKTPFLPYVIGDQHEEVDQTNVDYQIRSTCDNHQLHAEVV